MKSFHGSRTYRRWANMATERREAKAKGNMNTLTEQKPDVSKPADTADWIIPQFTANGPEMTVADRTTWSNEWRQRISALPLNRQRDLAIAFFGSLSCYPGGRAAVEQFVTAEEGWVKRNGGEK